jgi:hypothetical protein
MPGGEFRAPGSLVSRSSAIVQAGRPLAFSLLRLPATLRHLAHEADLRAPLGPLANRQVQVAAGLLALSLVLFAGILRAPVFVDEADNILTACLIARGSVPYREVFSHHFPAPYYALAALGERAACSVLAGRVLGVLLLTTAAGLFTWAARSALAPLGLVLMTLAAPLYYAQLYLAETFIGAGLILSMALLTERGRQLRGPAGLGLRGLAVLTLSASSPLGLMMAAMLTPMIVLGAGRPTTPIVGACAAGLLGWPLALAVQGTLPAFYEQAVRFNTEVYGPYLPVSLTDPLAVLWATLTFVRHRFSFGMDWLIGQDVKATTASFGAAFELLVLVLLGALVAARRDERLLRLALVLLLPLTVVRDGFHLAPFLALAGISCAHLIGWPGLAGARVRWQRATLVVGVAALLVALRVYLFALPAAPATADELSASLEPEPLVQRHAPPDAAVLYLPIAPQGYLADARRPGSFYTYFLPWVADLPGAQERLIQDIETQQVAVIVLDQQAAVWDQYRFSSYAPTVYAHIMSHYRPVDSGDRRKARIFVRAAP